MVDLFSDIRPEDLIISSKSGHKKVNHELVKNYGFFNLESKQQEEILSIYMHNASQRGQRDRLRVGVFIMLSRAINSFPFPVISNFTQGRAYEYNMKILEPYAQ